MIIVTNTIKVEKDFEDEFIKQFTENAPAKKIAEVEGFLGFELWKRTDGVCSEVIVMSKWDSAEAQQAWVKSDSFKKIHRRTKDSREQKRDREWVISSNVVQYEVVHSQNSFL